MSYDLRYFQVMIESLEHISIVSRGLPVMFCKACFSYVRTPRGQWWYCRLVYKLVIEMLMRL